MQALPPKRYGETLMQGTRQKGWEPLLQAGKRVQVSAGLAAEAAVGDRPFCLVP